MITMQRDTTVEHDFSYSQGNTRNRCEYQWYTTYVRGIRRRVERPAMSLGSAVHEALASKLLGNTLSAGVESWSKGYDRTQLFPEEVDEIDGITKRAYDIAKRAYDWLDIGHRFDTVSVDGVPLVEYHFELPLHVNGWNNFHGYIDWVCRDIDTGLVWLTDHKVRASFQGDFAEELNSQMAVYVHALRHTFGDLTISGSMSHQIKAKTPGIPKLNKPDKNGVVRVSKAAITTTWDVYKERVLGVGGDLSDYESVRGKLADVEWQRMSRAYWSPSVAAAMYHNLLCTLQAIIDRSKSEPVRSIGIMTCNGCDLKELCLSELRGEDVDFLLDTMYTTAKRGDNQMGVDTFIDGGIEL